MVLVKRNRAGMLPVSRTPFLLLVLLRSTLVYQQYAVHFLAFGGAHIGELRVPVLHLRDCQTYCCAVPCKNCEALGLEISSTIQ